jgi:hypothetical protein
MCDIKCLCIIDQNQFRICVPASDAVDGRLGDGVEQILVIRNGESVQMSIASLFITDMGSSASDSRID